MSAYVMPWLDVRQAPSAEATTMDTRLSAAAMSRVCSFVWPWFHSTLTLLHLTLSVNIKWRLLAHRMAVELIY